MVLLNVFKKSIHFVLLSGYSSLSFLQFTKGTKLIHDKQLILHLVVELKEEVLEFLGVDTI